MAYCSECGTQIANNHRFCGACGATVVDQPEGSEAVLMAPSGPSLGTAVGTTAIAAEAAGFRPAPVAHIGTGLAVGLLSSAAGITIATVVTIAFSAIIGVASKSEPFADYFFRLGDIAFAVPVLAGLIAGGFVGARGRSTSPTTGRWLALVASGIAGAFGLLICIRGGSALSGVIESGFYPVISSTPIPGAVLFVALSVAAGLLGWRGMRGGRALSVIAFGAGAVFISVCAPALWRFYQLLSMLGRP